MRKIFFFVFFGFLCPLVMNAQDLIVLRDASEIEAKVLTVSDAEISYKKWDFQDGPTYQLRRQEIFYIKYSNGSKDVFKNEESTESKTVVKPEMSNTISSPKKNIHKPLFSMNIEVGALFGTYLAGPTISFTPGAKINDYLFVGAKWGIDMQFFYYYRHEQISFIEIPIILPTIRGLLPVNANFAPYAEVSIGPNVLIATADSYGAEHMVAGNFQIGMGFEWKRFMLGIGYDCYFDYSGALHLGYLKMGVRIGKMK